MAIQRIRRDDRETWLKLRKQYIGGSDAAAVIGLNEWQSPYALWCEKRGIVPEFEGNLRTDFGAYIEDFIAKRFEQESGKKVRRNNFSLINSDFPWGIADLDREIIGESALLECKCTNELSLKHYANGDYPTRFYCQIQHYLAITGYEKAYLAVLIGTGRDFKIFEIERDEDEIAALMGAEKIFSEYLESGTPPPIDGSESTSEALNAQTNNETEEEPEPADLTDKKQALDTLGEIEQAIRQLEEQRDAIRNQLIQAIGDSWRGTVGDWYEVTYKPQSRKTFDWKKLQKEYPQFKLDPFFKTSVSRTLKIKQITDGN